MDLESELLKGWISTASRCADCRSPPYAQDMRSAETDRIMPTCRLVTYDMQKAVEEFTANGKVCPAQSVEYKPFFHKNKLRAHFQREPIGRYLCLKRLIRKLR